MAGANVVSVAQPTRKIAGRNSGAYRGARLLAEDLDRLSTAQRKSPENLKILGALCLVGRGDLNPKLQYPGQIKASAHYARNLDLLDCSQ